MVTRFVPLPVSVGCPVMTTISEFAAAVQAINALREHSWDIMSLQEHGVQLAAAGMLVPRVARRNVRYFW